MSLFPQGGGEPCGCGGDFSPVTRDTHISLQHRVWRSAEHHHVTCTLECERPSGVRARFLGSRHQERDWSVASGGRRVAERLDRFQSARARTGEPSGGPCGHRSQSGLVPVPPSLSPRPGPVPGGQRVNTAGPPPPPGPAGGEVGPPPRPLAPENKGAAPRAPLIGPSWSSERRSQSGGGAALGMARLASQSGPRARPACPGTGGAGEPSAQVAPGWQFPLTLATKSKVFIPVPSLRVPLNPGGVGRAEGQTVLWGRCPAPLFSRCLHPAAGWRRPWGPRRPLSSPPSGAELSSAPHNPWGRGHAWEGLQARAESRRGPVRAGGTGW